MKKNPVAIIGGSGLYQLDGLKLLAEETVTTPFGPPSDTVVRAALDDQEVLFLARHGRGHTLLPAEVNYRANIYALKTLGAVWCLSVSAVGSLAEDIRPGDLVVPDQYIDRTTGRAGTFFGNGIVCHASFADPMCATLRRTLLASCRGVDLPCATHDGGTYLCIDGPSFSCRAESKLFRQWSARIIGMTNLPEAKLAREAELAYATLGLVTDYDCWREGEKDVDSASVLERLRQMIGYVKQVIPPLVNALSSESPSPYAARALDNAIVTDLAHVPKTQLDKLQPLLVRYMQERRT